MLSRTGQLMNVYPAGLTRLLNDPKGKYALPEGWTYSRARENDIVINCGQTEMHNPDVFRCPIDIFISMDTQDVKAWHRECRKELGK